MAKELKKLVFYIDCMYHGGAQRVMVNLISYFREQGAEILLVNDFPPDGKTPEYELPTDVRRVFLRNQVEGNPLLKNLERISVLRRLLKEEQPELVLSFLGKTNQRMLLAAHGLPCKKVVSVRNDPNREYGPGGLPRALARRLFRLADGCVFQTGDAAAYFPEEVQQKAVIIKNPVAEPFFQVKRTGLGRDLVTMGRLEPQKNHELLIQAFSELAAEFPDQRLVLYGEGALRGQLEEQIRALGLEGRVVLAGDTHEVPRKLADCRLFVLSSDYEGMPNALLEALAAGVPAVSTDCPCGGPREVMENGVNGLLVPCGDRAALAAALRKLLEDKEAAAAMGEEAHRRAEEFRSEAIYRRWHQYFLGVMSRK